MYHDSIIDTKYGLALYLKIAPESIHGSVAKCNHIDYNYINDTEISP